jgi:hypothetical protein
MGMMVDVMIEINENIENNTITCIKSYAHYILKPQFMSILNLEVAAPLY